MGNWKMNPQAQSQAKTLIRDIKRGLPKRNVADVVLAPPFVYLPVAKEVRSGSKLFNIGAQDVSSEKLGPFTGEISAGMLKELSVSHVIIGHSERRAAGETAEEVNKKVHVTIKESLTAVVCVGERKRDHRGEYLVFVENQVRKACAGLAKTKLDNLVIAYEPIWAISKGDGKGQTATPEDTHHMKIFIQKTLTDIFGRSAAHKVKIIYGGSVNPKNAEALMKEGMVDGFLVGGASLRAGDFLKIIQLSV